MKKLIILFLGLCSQLNAQDVYTIFPENSNSGSKWYTIASGANTTLTYNFGGQSTTSKYGGYTEVVCWADTVTIAGDSLTVSIRPLFYNKVSGNLESSADTDADSVAVKDNFDWAIGTDSQYKFNVGANLPPCDGAQVNVYNNDTAVSVMVRIELRNARDR